MSSLLVKCQVFLWKGLLCHVSRLLHYSFVHSATFWWVVTRDEKAAYLIKSTGIASSVTANSELYWNLASRGSGKHLNTGMTKTHLKKTVIFRNPHHKIVDHYRVTLAIFGASCGAERRHYGHHQHSVFMDLFFGYVGK